MQSLRTTPITINTTCLLTRNGDLSLGFLLEFVFFVFPAFPGGCERFSPTKIKCVSESFYTPQPRNPIETPKSSKI